MSRYNARIRLTSARYLIGLPTKPVGVRSCAIGLEPDIIGVVLCATVIEQAEAYLSFGSQSSRSPVANQCIQLKGLQSGVEHGTLRIIVPSHDEVAVTRTTCCVGQQTLTRIGGHG